MQTVEALQKNGLANKSELFIYSDAPKNEDAQKSVKEVREYIKTIDGFKKVTIIEQERNLGLTNSIISGVTSIINKYGKIIVLEDDLVTSSYFLKFMNDALEFYKEEKRVWHINGYTHPIKIENKSDVFFTQFSISWGWATWSDRWINFKREPEHLIKQFDKKMINKFNLDGSSRSWKQVVKNKNGTMNTWAVFWYATIFLNNGFCLNSNRSLVNNIGHDGTGANCTTSNSYENELEEKHILNFEKNIEVNNEIYSEIKRFYRKQVYYKIINKIKNLVQIKVSDEK